MLHAATIFKADILDLTTNIDGVKYEYSVIFLIMLHASTIFKADTLDVNPKIHGVTYEKPVVFVAMLQGTRSCS